MSNPYAGQQYYEQAWQMGYDYAQANQNADITQPPDFSSWSLDDTTTGYVAQIWKEGALAGQDAGIPVQPVDVSQGENGMSQAGEVVHYAFTAFGVVRDIIMLEPAGLVAEGLLTILLGTSDTPDPDQDLKVWFAQKCQDGGWSEFFVTVAWPDGQAPTWYGHAHKDFDSAKAEIVDLYNNTPGPLDPKSWSLEVAHYRCDSPGEIEVIPVGITSP
jgi:hypothetical protein